MVHPRLNNYLNIQDIYMDPKLSKKNKYPKLTRSFVVVTFINLNNLDRFFVVSSLAAKSYRSGNFVSLLVHCALEEPVVGSSKEKTESSHDFRKMIRFVWLKSAPHLPVTYIIFGTRGLTGSQRFQIWDRELEENRVHLVVSQITFLK